MLRHHDVQLPQPPTGTITDAATAKALKAHGDLVARARAQTDTVEAATRAIEAAREEDRVSYAAALREGRPDPGRKALDKAETELEEARRKADALMLAAQGARDEVAQVVDDRRGHLLKQAGEQTETARENLRAAMVGLREAIAAFAQASNAELWCKRFPEPPGTVGGIRLLGLTAPNGETRTVDEVLAALEVYIAEA